MKTCSLKQVGSFFPMLEKGSHVTPLVRRSLSWLRRAYAVVFVLCGSVVFFVRPVFAQLQEASENLGSAAAASGLPGQTGSDLLTIVGRIINIFLGVMGTVFLFYLLYGGYTWMTSGGEMKGIERAKTVIRNALIGLVIIASAFGIANFILSKLEGVSEGGGGIVGSTVANLGFPNAAGSLGGGIIENHLPLRDARDVPRNTPIIVTFKEPIKISSLIAGYHDRGTPSDMSDDATSTRPNTDAFKLYRTGHADQALGAEDIGVRFTQDRKTFVFYQKRCVPTDPAGCLGSATANTDYTVQLTTKLLREDGRSAFRADAPNGYTWAFQVSTKVDLTPPKVVSVIPAVGGLYAPNIVVQANFSEPVDPTGASGVWKDGAGFGNVQVSARLIGEDAATRPNGEFKISNGYTTVEFVTDLACGTNTCGRTIYCLPSSAAITVLVKAATLSGTPPQAQFSESGYDGITDVVGNSLDGNGNGASEGPGIDDKVWSFGTSNRPNLDPPIVRETRPRAGDRSGFAVNGGSSSVPVDQIPEVDFDTVLQASTLTTESALIQSNEPQELADTFWWSTRQTLLTAEGKAVESDEDVPASGRARILHRMYVPASAGIFPEYDPAILSSLQNVYQNCFNPAASNACRGPHCCDDQASAGACRYPLFPFAGNTPSP